MTTKWKLYDNKSLRADFLGYKLDLHYAIQWENMMLPSVVIKLPFFVIKFWETWGPKKVFLVLENVVLGFDFSENGRMMGWGVIWDRVGGGEDWKRSI